VKIQTDTPTARPAPLDLLRMARGLLAMGKEAPAHDLARRALASAPGDARVRAIAASVLSHGVPAWHFSIIRDEARNAAYDDALRRAVRPGMKVLEIGAGSGILSMMAARAGARVVACEADPAVAEAARENIARNGYADRIKVVAKRSTDLDVAADLGERADLLVSEIISSSIVGQQVFPVMAHAAAELLTPEAPMIPAGASARVALGHTADLRWKHARGASGFDLSALDDLAPPCSPYGVGADDLILASPAFDLFDFDFRTAPATGEASAALEAHRPANCIVQWLELRMDAEGRYENRPAPGAKSCWAAIVWPLPNEVGPGERLAIGGAYEADALHLWAEAS
jgi:SAM-dependent methyltransferase